MFTSRKLCHRKLRKHKYRLLAIFIVLVIIFLAYQKVATTNRKYLFLCILNKNTFFIPYNIITLLVLFIP